MRRYELVEHTADAKVICTGASLEECFGNAAYALFDQMVDATTIRDTVSREIRTSGADDEERLYSFLSELLFVMETESLVFADFDVRFAGDEVLCTAVGERLDLSRHRPRTEVKAITYHELSVERNPPRITVIFDV